MQIFDIENILKSGDNRWNVLGGTERSQVALMVLQPGQASGQTPSVHPGEDQLLYLIRGEVTAEVGDETAKLSAGQLIVVPANTPHRFINEGQAPAETLNFYAPPAF